MTEPTDQSDTVSIPVYAPSQYPYPAGESVTRDNAFPVWVSLLWHDSGIGGWATR